MNLGYYYTRTGIAALGMRYHEQARQQFARLVKEKPNDVEFLSELRRAYTNIGYLEQSLNGRMDRALIAFNKAREILDQLTRDHPAVVLYQLSRVGNYNQLANALIALGAAGNADGLLRSAQALAERLHQQNPADLDCQYQVGEVHLQRGKMYTALQKPREALAELEQARTWEEKVFRANSGSLDNRLALVRTYRLLATAQQQTGDRPAAEKSLVRAAELCDEVDAATASRSHLLRVNRVVVYSELASLHEAAARTAEAERAHRRMLRVREEAGPGELSHEMLSALGTGCLRHGQFQIKDKRPAEARKALEEAERIFGQTGPIHLYQLACTRALLSTLVDGGSAVSGAGAPSPRQRYADQAVADLRQFLRVGGVVSSVLLKRGPALQPLAGHADFQALVAEREVLEKSVQENAEHMKRAARLVQEGDHARAADELKPVLASKLATHIDYYNGACVYSLASAAARKDAKLSDKERVRLEQEYADRAMELLRQAVNRGYRLAADVAHMKTDTDLDPLRRRDDFRKLMASLEEVHAPSTSTDKSRP
jgi:tetratricopeptide (TPR) repeat protein